MNFFDKGFNCALLASLCGALAADMPAFYIGLGCAYTCLSLWLTNKAKKEPETLLQSVNMKPGQSVEIKIRQPNER